VSKIENEPKISLPRRLLFIVFWPAAFFVKGEDAQTAELARLKGEFETIQQVSVRKGCNTQFQSRGAPANLT
jgi:hypothetical protein